MKIRLQRTNEPDLEFEGEELARSTSRRDHDQPRWTELVVYKSDTGKWVLNVLGRSAIPGETDRSNVAIETHPEDFVERFYSPDGDGGYRLSFPAKVLLRKLAAIFPRIAVFDLKETI